MSVNTATMPSLTVSPPRSSRRCLVTTESVLVLLANVASTTRCTVVDS